MQDPVGARSIETKTRLTFQLSRRMSALGDESGHHPRVYEYTPFGLRTIKRGAQGACSVTEFDKRDEDHFFGFAGAGGNGFAPTMMNALPEGSAILSRGWPAACLIDRSRRVSLRSVGGGGVICVMGPQRCSRGSAAWRSLPPCAGPWWGPRCPAKAVPNRHDLQQFRRPMKLRHIAMKK
jgi:hypothetical protein